jgi:hypothetical protein
MDLLAAFCADRWARERRSPSAFPECARYSIGLHKADETRRILALLAKDDRWRSVTRPRNDPLPSLRHYFGGELWSFSETLTEEVALSYREF